MVAIWNFGYFENELMAEDVENVSLQHFQRPKKSFWKFEIEEIFRFIPSLSMYAKKKKWEGVGRKQVWVAKKMSASLLRLWLAFFFS